MFVVNQSEKSFLYCDLESCPYMSHGRREISESTVEECQIVMVSRRQQCIVRNQGVWEKSQFLRKKGKMKQK